MGRARRAGPVPGHLPASLACALDQVAPALACVLAVLLLSSCATSRGVRPAAGPGRPGGPAAKARLAHHRPGGRTYPAGTARGGPGEVFILGHGGAAGTIVALPAGGTAGGIVALPAGGTAGGFVVLPAGGVAGGSGRPRIVAGPVPRAGSAQTVALPLDSYEQVAVQQQEALAAAGDELTQRCMAAKGFSYPAAPQPGGAAADVRSVEHSGYGITSLAQAQTYGYRQPGHAAGSGSPGGIVIPGFVSEQGQHGQAWTSALLGFVPGSLAGARQPQGCLQAAYYELYGRLDGNPDPDPVPGIGLQAAQWTQSDPRVLAAERVWSACMARGGFRYRSPAQAQDRGWPSALTPAEVATAVSDVRCKTQANLVNIWLTVEAAYQQALISQNLTFLARLQDIFGTLLRRAETLLQLPPAAILPVSPGRP